VYRALISTLINAVVSTPGKRHVTVVNEGGVAPKPASAVAVAGFQGSVSMVEKCGSHSYRLPANGKITRVKPAREWKRVAKEALS